MPEQDFKKVSEAEKDEIEERMENAKAIADKLITYLDGAGYDLSAQGKIRHVRLRSALVKMEFDLASGIING